MNIFIEKEQKKVEFKFEGSVSSLLDKLDINPETVLVVSNDELMNEDDLLDDECDVKIISVVSGG